MTQEDTPELDATQLATPATETVHTGDTRAAPEAMPSAIGRFGIVSKLGEGGMGTVLLAVDPLLGRQVALKMMHRDRGDPEASGRRLQREAQGIAKLIHENVIVVHEVGTHEGRVYLAMEYVAGQTLTRWQVGRGWREILDAYLRAGRGLVAAHDAGLVHRDFKPDNVLVGDDGRLRVTDFGLVATIDAMIDAPSREATSGSPMGPADLATRLTATGALLGTPRYMAPEQYRAEPVDARADQFAFSAALYEALYGKPAFAGATLAEISSNILAGAVQPVPAGADVPAAARDAILRGLSGDRNARFPHLRDLLATLAGVVEGSTRAPRRRRTGLATAAIAGIALVAGLASWAATRGSSHSEATSAAASAPGPASDPLQEARVAFDEAQRAYLRGDYESAAAGYLAAYAARPYPQFLFNAAASHQHAAALKPNDRDEYAKAIALYQRYLVSAPADSASVARTISMLESATPSDAVSHIPAPKPRGAVMIESVPEGATIYLDTRTNAPLATTPWAGALTGDHKVIVEMPGYVQSQTIISPDPEKLFTLRVELAKEVR